MINGVGESLPIQQGTLREEQDWSDALRQAHAVLNEVDSSDFESISFEVRRVETFRSHTSESWVTDETSLKAALATALRLAKAEPPDSGCKFRVVHVINQSWEVQP